MTVVAHCQSCTDEHPLSDRIQDDSWAGTTVCPVCGSPGYTTTETSDTLVKSEAQRITDAVEPVHGVGEQTRQNIVTAFGLYAELDTADTGDLTAIDGVGEQTARRIQDRLTRFDGDEQ